MKYQFLISSALAFSLIACNQPTPQASTPKILGILEVAINDSAIGATKFIPAKIGTQAVINENEITFAPAAGALGNTNLSVESNAPRNFDYVSRIFTITNKTGGQSTMNNLSLVALAQTGNAAPTTALKTITNFNGNTVNAATAQLARPTHRMTGNGAVVVDTSEPYRASFQAFTTAEISPMQTQANALSYSGTVLEYGFVATTTGATGSRTLADGASANVAIAMRFPSGGGAGVYNFVMTFIVFEGGATRVTRSPEESTANANTRAGNVSTTPSSTVTKVLIDDPAVITTPPTGFTVQNNVKIGTGASQTLLKNSAKLVIARVYAAASGSLTGTPYDNDFVEIFNSGEFSATLSGKSLQYGSNSAEIGGTAANVKDVTALGIIPSGGYKLVGATASTGVTPTSDTTIWGTGFNLGIGGKVGLVNSTTALNCGGATVCTGPQNTSILDLLGYSTATSTKFEGTQLTLTAGVGFDNQNPAIAFTRINNGCTDANNNSTDFAKANIYQYKRSQQQHPCFYLPINLLSGGIPSSNRLEGIFV